MSSLCSCTYWPSVCLSGKMSVRVLCTLFNWIFFVWLSYKVPCMFLTTELESASPLRSPPLRCHRYWGLPPLDSLRPAASGVSPVLAVHGQHHRGFHLTSSDSGPRFFPPALNLRSSLAALSLVHLRTDSQCLVAGATLGELTSGLTQHPAHCSQRSLRRRGRPLPLLCCCLSDFVLLLLRGKLPLVASVQCP